MYVCINFYLIACQPALPRLACLNHSVWLVVDVRIIAVAVSIKDLTRGQPGLNGIWGCDSGQWGGPIGAICVAELGCPTSAVLSRTVQRIRPYAHK